MQASVEIDTAFIPDCSTWWCFRPPSEWDWSSVESYLEDWMDDAENYNGPNDEPCYDDFVYAHGDHHHLCDDGLDAQFRYQCKKMLADLRKVKEELTDIQNHGPYGMPSARYFQAFHGLRYVSAEATTVHMVVAAVGGVCDALFYKLSDLYLPDGTTLIDVLMGPWESK